MCEAMFPVTRDAMLFAAGGARSPTLTDGAAEGGLAFQNTADCIAGDPEVVGGFRNGDPPPAHHLV